MNLPPNSPKDRNETDYQGFSLHSQIFQFVIESIINLKGTGVYLNSMEIPAITGGFMGWVFPQTEAHKTLGNPNGPSGAECW